MTPQLFAVTRAGVREADIFRLWLEFYRPYVDGFFILLVREAGDDIAPLETLCRDVGAAWKVHDCPRFESHPALAALRAGVALHPCTWVLHTDTDELLRHPQELRQLIACLEAEGADHLAARMIDRFAPEGRLRNLDGVSTPEALAAAFPVQAEVTRHLAGGNCHKRCLARWPAVCIHDRTGSLTNLSARRGLLDHYKWRTGLRDRLTKRFIDYTLAGISWAGESGRLLDELQTHGRFRVEQWPAKITSTAPSADSMPRQAAHP